MILNVPRLRFMPPHNNPVNEKSIVCRIVCGGAGTNTEHILRRQSPDTADFGLSIDIDPKWRPDYCMRLSPNQLKAMLLHASGFEPSQSKNTSEQLTVARIVNSLSDRLNPDDLSAGAGTTRCITQLAYFYHRESILYSIRDLFARVRKSTGCQNIVPLLAGSDGGGTGSALMVLLANDLMDAEALSLICRNSDRVSRPVIYSVGPYCYANDSSVDQRSKILANSLAFRIETDYLLRNGLQAVFHMGYENDAQVVLDDSSHMIQVMADLLQNFSSNWSQIKAKAIDGSGSQTRIHFDAYHPISSF